MPRPLALAHIFGRGGLRVVYCRRRAQASRGVEDLALPLTLPGDRGSPRSRGQQGCGERPRPG